MNRLEPWASNEVCWGPNIPRLALVLLERNSWWIGGFGVQRDGGSLVSGSRFFGTQVSFGPKMVPPCTQQKLSMCAVMVPPQPPTTLACLFRVCKSQNWGQKQANSMPWMMICSWPDSAKFLIGSTCCHFPGHSLEWCLWLSIQGSSFFSSDVSWAGKEGIFPSKCKPQRLQIQHPIQQSKTKHRWNYTFYFLIAWKAYSSSWSNDNANSKRILQPRFNIKHSVSTSCLGSQVASSNGRAASPLEPEYLPAQTLTNPPFKINWFPFAVFSLQIALFLQRSQWEFGRASIAFLSSVLDLVCFVLARCIWARKAATAFSEFHKVSECISLPSSAWL